jgi:hypothetical protein
MSLETAHQQGLAKEIGFWKSGKSFFFFEK